MLKHIGNKRTNSHANPLNAPNIHIESTTNASGNRKIMVTLPNINTASPDSSNSDKPNHAAMPIIGHGIMTRTEPKIARHGKEMTASYFGEPEDDNGVAKEFSGSLSNSFLFFVDGANRDSS